MFLCDGCGLEYNADMLDDCPRCRNTGQPHTLRGGGRVGGRPSKDPDGQAVSGASSVREGSVARERAAVKAAAMPHERSDPTALSPDWGQFAALLQQQIRAVTTMQSRLQGELERVNNRLRVQTFALWSATIGIWLLVLVFYVIGIKFQGTIR